MDKNNYKKYIDDNFTFLAISDAYSLIDYIFEKFDFEMEAYRQCEEQLKNCETALDEALERIKELEQENDITLRLVASNIRIKD